MKKSLSYSSFLLSLPIILLFSLAIAPSLLQAQSSAADQLDAAWRRARASGAYRFSADVTQTDKPLATVLNAGRSSRHNQLYLEGRTDLKADRLEMRLWSGGGSVQLPESAVEMKIEGTTAQMRQGNGPWQEIDDFSNIFAPGGDFLSYTQFAKNAVRHGPERLETVAGPVEVTRYTFDIDGRAYALQMHAQMRQQALREGLPANVRLELPKQFSAMSGQGELWVGADGLPLRQVMHLQFPPDDNTISASEIAVTFFDFAQTPTQQAASLWHWGADRALSVLSAGAASAALLSVALACCFAWLVLTRRRSRLVYAGVAIGVIVSMLVTPLLTADRVVAFSTEQAAKAAAQEAERAEADAHRELEEQLAAPTMDPHANPLAATAEAAAGLAQAATASRYYDSSCDTDPNGDLDGDGLTNLSECLLGTLPSVADTDGDGANDKLEVVGFSLGGKQWYANPLAADSNNDGIPDGKELHMDANGNSAPDDTDGDGAPDLWDDDNDGDGVPDKLDISPYMSTGAGSAAAKTFTDDAPLQITMNNLLPSEMTKVEFQVVPTNPDHLRYTQTILDWPLNDKQGQIQDVDGKTFYDVMDNVAANPGANGDLRLIPALEIQMPKASANLPPADSCSRDDGSRYTCYPLLEDFNISVREVTTGTLAAYVPLQLVSDSTGDNAVAFYGRMFYQAANGWGAAHDVRFVWMVQVLNDVCARYEDNICAEYGAYNQPQLIQTYSDEWRLSGLHVTEEHQANIALIYEVPTITPGVAGAPANYDKPFYADTLYGLLNGLDQSFLAGRSDMTVDTIAGRFDHATNSGVSDTERWNLPNVMSVDKHSYEAYDLGVIDTVVTQTVNILDNVFTPAWSASNPITPTVMMASEKSHRDLNLDTTHFSSGNLKWSGNGLTIDWTNTAVDTIASVKWTPYSYDPASGWTTADLGSYLDEYTDHLRDVLDANDPDTPSVLTMNKMLYTTAYNGVSEFVAIDGEAASEGAEEDGAIGLELTIEIGKLTREVVKWISEFDEKISELAEVLEQIDQTTSAATGVQNLLQYVFLKAQGLESKAFGAYMFESVALVLEVTELLLEQFARNSPVTEGVVFTVELADVVVKALNAVTKVYGSVGAFQKLLAINTTATEAQAVAETVSEASSIISVAQILFAFSFVLAIGLAVGTLIYLATSDDIQPGSPEYTTAVVSVLVTLVITVLLLIVAITNPIGLAIVATIALIDAFLTLIGVQWSITGKIAEAVSSIVYQYDVVMGLDADSGAIGIELGDPSLGLREGNDITYSLPLTPTFSSGDDCFSKYAPPVYTDARMWFMLSEEEEDMLTILEHNDWKTTPNSGFKGWKEQIQSYSDTLDKSGINQVAPLILSTEYMILGQNSWFFGIVGTCNQKWNWGTSHTPFGDALVLDVLPDSLDKLVDVTSWTAGDLAIRSIDADGDGLIATRYGGSDLDDAKWDQDGDTLSDGYELRVRSLPSGQGGAALSPSSADTDGDGVPDNVELRWGTDPARSDSDGDGLRDEQEIAPGGGWQIAYAHNASTGVSSETLVWSSPTQPDADGDGMSDLFEQAQYITEPAPFADPTNPLVYNPNVWNESPVALYVTDGSTDGYVAPGATIAYTATTVNNLSSGQQLVGELSLSLPSGVNGSPLRQPVDINSGESGALVSSVTFGSTTGGYDLSSAMSLTDFDQTRWSWAETDGAITQGLNGTPTAIAFEPVEGWEGAYLVATIEKMSNGNEAISSYLVRSDGSLAGAPHSVVQSASPTPHLNPDLACNDQGICLLVMGLGGIVENIVFHGSYTNSAIGSFDGGGSVKGASVASDGANFMTAVTQLTNNGAQTAIKVTKLSSTGGPLVTNEVATLNGTSGAAAIAWTGTGYKVVWTGDGNIHQADVNANGVVSNASVVGAGSAWPQSNGNVHPLSIAYDEISGQALVTYRSAAGALVARQLGGSVSDEITIAADGVSGDNVTVALSADPKNSGWVAAWTPSAGGQTAFSAISPLGAVRTNLTSVDKSTLTAVALACLEPRPLLQLDFEEEAGATLFADSSGHKHDATCGAACPEAGVSGKAGSAISLATTGQALLANGINLANSSFTLAAWVAYRSFGGGSTIMAQGEYQESGQGAMGLYLAKRANDTVVCTMNDAIYAVSPEPVTDTLWHHWACTYETTTKRVTLYEDGEVVASATARSNYVGSGAFSIGTGTIFPGPFDGSLDGVVVYDRALSAREISDTFNTALAIYDLDEAPGSTTFVNAVPNGIDATCAGAGCPAMGVEGKAFTAAHFDGSHFITIPAAPSATETHYYTFDDGNYAGWNPGATGLLAASVAGQSTQYLDSRHESSVGNNISLNLSNLPQHDSVTISYDLYVLGTDWVGTQNRTASALRMQIDQVQVLETTFSNVSSAAQDYPNLAGWAAANSPTYPYKSGQVQKTLTVSGMGDDATAIYRISETYPHASASLSIAWYNAGQKRYGLDNVKIDVNQTNTSLPLNNASFTLSAWANTDDPANQGYLVSQGPGQANQGLRFGLQSGEAFCGFWSNTLRVNLTLDTEWHHWACTYDAATKQRTLYRDGVQIGQDTASSNYLGEGATAIGELFQGAIDEVGVFPAALTADDVKQLYDKVKLEDESTLVCQLPLTASDGQIAFGVLTLRETTTRLGDISQSLQRTLTVDGDKPATANIDTAYFSQSAPGPYVRSADALVFAGSASDSTSYITKVEVNPGKGWVAAAGTETWAYRWETSGLSDGPHTIQVRATDTVGNQSNAASWHTILDNTGPVVTVNGPVRIARPNRNAKGRWRVTVTGTASDPAAGGQPGSGVAAVEVLLQGSAQLQGLGWQPATLHSDGSWTLDYVLPVFNKHGAAVANPSGLYTATVRATDVVSNVTVAGASSANTFALDAAAPTVAASNSLSSTQIITQGIAIGGPVADNDAVQTVEINFTPGEQMGALEDSVLHLAMDENQATEYIRDQSVANNNASCSDSHCPTVGQAGQRDLAVRFDGIGQYLTLPSVLDPAATPFSAAAWFNINAVGEIQYILQQSDGTGTGRTWLAVETDGAVRSFLGGSALTSTTKVVADSWYHAAVTYDGVTLKLYLDGMLEASAVKKMEESDGALLIGAFKTLNDFYAGEIDELTIHDRALADYEVANLYAYGQGTWEAATLSNGAWSYTIPEGDNGLEGIYQINVRGKDALGNITQAGGQRVWRGEIDTKAPQLQFLFKTDSSGSVPTTRYECYATDANLLQESDANGLQTTSCVPGTEAGPFFRNGDVTLTQYGDVNLWYGATFTETARLYAIDAVRTYTGTAVTEPTMTACDAYNHCTEVAAVSPPLASGSVSSELLTPAPGTVLTSLDPVTMSGDLYARDGLHALMVLVNDTPAHAQIWSENDGSVSSAGANTVDLRTHSSTWRFQWTPPGEGLYRIVTHLSDWAGRGSYWSYLPVIAQGSRFALDQPPAEQNELPPLANAKATFLPLIAVGDDGRQTTQEAASVTAQVAPQTMAFDDAESDPFSQYVSQIVASGALPATLDGVSGIFTHTIGTIYVDLTPPQVTIEPTRLTPAQQISRYTLKLAGQVSDATQVQRVDVRIGDGAWQRAGLNGDNTWHLYWQFGDLRALTGDQTVQVTVRATDIAGRTTEVTEAVTVQAE
ncbi:MAG: hypothetical protein KDE54_00420 [Caldilineaceae bacterium]|nr:hypothetical protein [Caldilineaceae bacterium]MCB0139579.1 hypothetical protein [Caldilineaceae bacterium]